MNGEPEISRNHFDFNSLLEQLSDTPLPLDNIVRVEFEIPPLAPLHWLMVQESASRYYWTSWQRDFEMAGIGEADVLASNQPAEISGVIRRLRTRLCAGTVCSRYYGGFRFHHREDDASHWRAFSAFRFVVPQFEVCRNLNTYTFAVNLSPDTDKDELMRAARRLVFPGDAASPVEATLPMFNGRTDRPDKTAWNALVNQALERIASGTFEKVVLARETSFCANNHIEPLHLLHALLESTVNVYLFCFQPTPGRAFLGASPECLLRSEGAFVRSDALAGTRPRGKRLAQDEELARELRACEKENREHRIVVEDIRDIFSRHGANVLVGKHPSIRKLAHCQHLHTPVSAELKTYTDDAMLLEELHPTSAVGGRPRDAALQWLWKNEPIERGIYASPVGWVAPDSLEFCVGIRSGLVLDNTLTLYSGAGIVEGAQADNEWDELNAKICSFLRIIHEMKDDDDF